jgi:hypothetical protein
LQRGLQRDCRASELHRLEAHVVLVQFLELVSVNIDLALSVTTRNDECFHHHVEASFTFGLHLLRDSKDFQERTHISIVRTDGRLPPVWSLRG